MKEVLNPMPTIWNVLIVDDVHPILTEGLSKLGHNVLYLPNANRDEIRAALPNQHILVIRTKTIVDEDLLVQANSLKIIARAGAGMDNIDCEYTESKSIISINAGEANSDAVAEQSLAMLLMLLNNLCRANAQVKAGVWLREANRGIELAGKTLAIIGYGNTGKAFAQKLSAMKVKVLVYDKYLHHYGSSVAKESNWEEICEQADILSFHVPLTAETTYYFNKNLLAQFKKPIFLLNLSRGKVVNTQDLILGLNQGKILGAALDVLENERLENLNATEKLQFNYLCERENVVLSPHIGGWTKESYIKISQVLLDKLLTFS
jgi:D-3-phosphoglycerate dehydrogenase